MILRSYCYCLGRKIVTFLKLWVSQVRNIFTDVQNELLDIMDHQVLSSKLDEIRMNGIFLSCAMSIQIAAIKNK